MRHAKMRKFLAAVVACALLGSAVSPTVDAQTVAPTIDTSLKVHPLLQYGAQVEPTKLVRVIVQKANPGASKDSIAKPVGGQVVQEFHVIPAFVMNVTQSAVLAVAKNPDVRYVSPDGPVRKKAVVDSSKLVTNFPAETGATAVWAGTGVPSATGANVTVAVLDTGIDPTHPDLAHNIEAINVNQFAKDGPVDDYGHGTHVSSIITGTDPNGKYLGVAPNATVISVKISDDAGVAYESDLLRGLDWVDANRTGKHIRVLNLSVSTAVAQSYATSPINAAVENLWHDGVTVVAAAGNLGAAEDAVWYAPANDPYVITVGCLDDNQTVATADDSLCPISSRGITEDGFAKPDLVAPGRQIASALGLRKDHTNSRLARDFPDRISADLKHLRLSGTSMAAPMVTGAVALLLERYPTLTPDQIKALLVRTARTYPGQQDGAGALDILKVLGGAGGSLTTPLPGPLPVGGVLPPSGANTLLWDGARWGSTYWDGARWGSSYWDGARWGSATWDGARWGSAYWDGARWGSAYWDGARWGSADWETEEGYD
jgi:serine protease AprX